MTSLGGDVPSDDRGRERAAMSEHCQADFKGKVQIVMVGDVVVV